MHGVRPRLALLMPIAVLAALIGPAAAGAHVRTGRVAVDYRASVSALRKAGAPAPDWRLRSSGRSFIWHDARVRGLPHGVERGRWTVPLVLDGRNTRVDGEIWRVGAPSPWPWLALGAVFLAFTAVLLARRRQPLLRTAALVLGVLTVAVTIPAEAGFALASTASAGAWVEGANVLAFTMVGLAFVVLGSRDSRALAGGALGLLGLAVGLTKLPVLLHGVVLSAFPDLAARATVVLAIAAGAAATAIGLAVFFDVLEHYEEPIGLEYPL